MERSFIAVTAIASTLMFAGVWKATEPQPTAPPAIVDTKAVPNTPVTAPPALRRHVVAPARPASEAEPYNVVRPAYESSPPARRSTSGQPGYREGMDGDGDGIACEDYR
jgi:hypothetical protein